MSRGVRTLAIVLSPDGSPPAEFRLFVSGWNDTENGRFLFDAEAASAVMAAHEKWGVDLMIDLEHQALNAGTPPEPTARDARGWFRLELRPDGSLWAVGVTWTPDGAQRLADKRQRYVSPAFGVDPETSRITSIINCALVAIPATHDTPALVAASRNGESMLDAALISKALEAIAAGDEAGALDLLKTIVAAAAGGESDTAAEDAVDGGADDATETQQMAADPAAPPKPEEEKPAEMAAALSAVASLSGKSSLVASVADIRTWHASHVALAAERDALAKREAILEGAERRKLCTELVTLGGRPPAQVWASPDAGSPPKPYLAKMPIADLREMHADAVKASGRPAAIKPPPAAESATPGDVDFTTPHGVQRLSARQIAECKSLNVDPAVFAGNLAFQNKSRSKE